ncbi:MAG: LamG domain-containing protein [Lentisphaerae bacterium]|nr:LamG domain-containing protein [Lentisphaerota bacterium]
MKSISFQGGSAWAAGLLFLGLTAVAPAQDGLWLGWDFENTLEPSGGEARTKASMTLNRDSELVAPDGRATSDRHQPCFVAGVSGKGLFLGGQAENLLKPDFADMNLDGGELFGISALAEAVLKPAEQGAWFGETCLKVATSKEAGSGISIPVKLSGGNYGPDKPFLYVFSLHIKGHAALSLEIGPASGACSDPKTLQCTDEWKRHTVWMFAGERVEAVVKLKTAGGGESDFFIDGLQLEKKDNAQVSVAGRNAPRGKDFSPGPWAPGGKAVQADRLSVSWPGAKFHSPEGTFSVWLKPLFNRDDAEGHVVISRSHMFYQLMFQPQGTLFFARANEGDDRKENPWGAIGIPRPGKLEKDAWSLLTATWSNADKRTRLYFNGEPLGEKNSFFETDMNRNETLQLGVWNPDNLDGLNGVLDDLKIFSRALSADEIKAEYERGVKALK